MMKRKAADEEDKSDRWVVSYADFITLLFAFFTTMYAISHVDRGKLEKFTGSMRSAFSAEDPGAPPRPIIEGVPPANYADMALEDAVRSAFQKFDIIEGIAISRNGRGVTLSFEDTVLFETGSAVIKDDARRFLQTVASVIESTGNPVVIEGHTDSLPIRNSRYGSNWELSAARATAVLTHLVREHRLRPERFSAAGYGEYRPLATNATSAGRSRNRRVDILFVSAGHDTYGAVR